MSVTFAQTASITMFASSSTSRIGSDPRASTSSWEETRQPIPWEDSNNSSRRTETDSAYGHNSQSRAAALGSNTAASRSRVSMDALPVDDDASSHTTISPSSSSASLPMMDEMTTPPPPRATAIQPAPFARPVGLGLSADAQGSEWPLVQGAVHTGEVDSDDDEMNDQNEMDSYMASHRAPVDAALRSMPGVVGLGDGWAGGPQNKPKRKGWFRRKTKEEVETAEADPLALWTNSDSAPSSAVTSHVVVETSPTADNQQQQQHDAKWWKSRRNLFSASQRVLTMPPLHNSSASSPPNSAKTRTHPPSAAANRQKNLRSKFNFGSMVDLVRPENRQNPSIAFPSLDQSSPSSASTATTPIPSKRHSVAGFLRKPPPHPLELSHGNGSSHASKSQPLVMTASTSQPSLLSPTHHHPILRQAFARSESNISDTGLSAGPPLRPVSLIINSGAFVNSGPMPQWRPPIMSPTPLLEVQEEDEEEESDLSLKRSATFGDEDEYATQKASAPPGLSDITGSPAEDSRALSVSTTYSSKNGELAPPPQKFLHRLKSVLTLGGGRKPSMASLKSPKIPESPRSFQSEQMTAFSTPEAAREAYSVGHSDSRRRSRLFSRRRETVDALAMTMTPRPVIAAESPPPVLSPAVGSPMLSVPSPARASIARFGKRDDGETVVDRSSLHAGLGLGSSLGVDLEPRRNRRTSWAAPLPTIDNTDDDDDEEDAAPTRRVEKRLSRVSLRRFTAQSKQRPPLGTVFPRPPTEMQAPPSLHWAFPASYSTPMLHKFGGSTLSLALDISAEGVSPSHGLEDIRESPRSAKPAERRERAISATIAALTARQSTVSLVGENSVNPSARHSNLRARRTVPININNLNSSNDSLSLPTCNLVDFPLPPSDSSGDVSSPDPDQVEHLCTPRDPRQYPTLPLSYYRRRTMAGSAESGDSGNESASSSSSQHLHKQPSWSTCKTSGETVGSGRATPLATPTSSSSDEARCSSYGSLITAMEGDSSDVELTPRAPAYTTAGKRLSAVPATNQQIVA